MVKKSATEPAGPMSLGAPGAVPSVDQRRQLPPFASQPSKKSLPLNTTGEIGIAFWTLIVPAGVPSVFQRLVFALGPPTKYSAPLNSTNPEGPKSVAKLEIVLSRYVPAVVPSERHKSHPAPV